jgi:hypothetical protein
MKASSRLARAAIGYAERGWHVFPQIPKDKAPLIKGGRGFYDATDDVAAVTAWWGEYPTANIGLWPGPSGFAVLDLDGDDVLDAARSLGALETATLECRTGREGGRHLYFLRPEFTVTNSRPLTKLEIRCDKGAVTLPPSIHPSGRVYAWANRGAGIQPLPTRLRNALWAAQERLTDYGRGADVEPTLSPNEQLDRRASAYIARIGHVAEGQGRNNAAYQIAAFLTRDLAIAGEAALAYLADWNRGNAPPLATRELRLVLASARRHARREVGAGLERPHRLTGSAWTTAAERALREARGR